MIHEYNEQWPGPFQYLEYQRSQIKWSKNNDLDHFITEKHLVNDLKTMIFIFSVLKKIKDHL